MREKAKKNERRDTCRMMMNAECKRNKKMAKTVPVYVKCDM